MLTPEQIRHLRATIERAGTLTTGGRYSAIQREGYWTVLDGNGVGFADVLLREEARGLAALLNALPGLLVMAEDLATLQAAERSIDEVVAEYDRAVRAEVMCNVPPHGPWPPGDEWPF